MALTYLDSAMIELPATITTLSAVNLQATNLTATNIQTPVLNNVQLWNNISTVVQSNSASWEETADIIPTVVNYLSTQNIVINTATLNSASAASLQVGSITNSTNVIGDLTVYGTLTALSGFNVVIATTTSTSALSVSNIQARPALDVYQGPASSTIAVFKNNTGNIVNVIDAGLTVNGILSTNSTGDSNLWNATYTNVQTNSALWASNVDTGVRALTSNWQSTYLTVSALSASWEESQDILPTVTNYLSTSNVRLSSLTVTGNISAASIQTPVLSNLQTWNDTYTLVQNNSASWEETADILPTVTNYLSTSNVRLSSLTVTGNISATGTASMSALNIVSGNVFPKTTFNNLVSALAINVNGTTLYMPLLSAI